MNEKILENSMIVFDIDGVLCKYDFEAKDRKCWESEEWIQINIHENPYAAAKRIKIFDKLIESKKPEDMCVLSTALCSHEQKNKQDFLKTNFHKIPQDQIFFVGSDKYKTDVLYALRKSLDNMGQSAKKIVMIEDNPSIMMEIEGMRNPKIRCLLISDFVD